MEYRVLSFVDHTLLNPTATWKDIIKVCEEAMEYQTASVCVPPSFIARIRDRFESLNICTVIGFPLGYMESHVKNFELLAAKKAGANEFDMVINIGDAKAGDFGKITEEIKLLKATAGDNILKVITETCYLTEGEKIALCKAVTEGGADYIKTSTGFGAAGATFKDIELFKQHIGPGVKIKAAGGIAAIEDLETFIYLGCSRIGTSRAIGLVTNTKTRGY